MSTIKISQLPTLSAVNSNTANSLFVSVDIPTGVTGKLTAGGLASSLYSYFPLNVGIPVLQLPNVIAHFANSSVYYTQISQENKNNLGTADYVVTANTGSDTTWFIDMGYTNSQYSNTSPNNSLGTIIEPLSGYLYVQGNTQYATGQSGNFVLGTATPGTELRFIVGGINNANSPLKLTSSSLVLRNSANLTFSDGSMQNVAAAPVAFTQAAFNTANNVQGALNTANSNIAFLIAYSAGAYGLANTSLQNTSTIVANNNLTVPGTLTVGNNVIYTPNSYSGTISALTLDMSANSRVKCNIGPAGLVVTLTNITPGREVQLIIMNTDNQNRTVTHGALAMNSTKGSVTYTHSAASTAFLKYFSTYNDIGNVYVSITNG